MAYADYAFYKNSYMGNAVTERLSTLKVSEQCSIVKLYYRQRNDDNDLSKMRLSGGGSGCIRDTEKRLSDSCALSYIDLYTCYRLDCADCSD